MEVSRKAVERGDDFIGFRPNAESSRWHIIMIAQSPKKVRELCNDLGRARL
jgi:hypothetical protein